jgi:hypothetical protein
VKTRPFDPDILREALEQALPQETSHYGEAPRPEHLYVPRRHEQALSPDHSLVVGIRGAGKSVWWAALQSPRHRDVVAAALARPVLADLAAVSAGFGETPRYEDYPGHTILRKLLAGGIEPADIWRSVLAWHTWGRRTAAPFENWEAWIARLAAQPEQAARAFQEYDGELATQNRKHLILFDALDLTARRWDELRRLLRGLLEVLLEFRRFRAIRAKAFIRPDMLDDPAVTSFPDASKVTAGKVELRWSRADLYGLLFHLVAQAQEGNHFREGCEALGSGSWAQVQGIWQVPRRLREEEDLQRPIFHALAGEWMGRGRKRAFPYTWLPGHLADAAGQVSPRSFLAALRAAVEHPRSDGWDHTLHWDGIKRGVQEASKIRVDEVRENFPWIPILMTPLRGLVIPCDFSAISARWQDARVLDQLEQQAQAQESLPPKHLPDGLEGLRTDLLELALFSLQPDGRINMPDVYRVGFGLGRRGGVKPIR